MCEESIENILEEYKKIEGYIADNAAGSKGGLGWRLLRMSKLLINYGELLKVSLKLSSPKELAAEYAERALKEANETDHILKAESYLLISNARWFFPIPPHKENAILCEKALQEISIWICSCEGEKNNEEEYLRIQNIKNIAKANRALYLHYANDFSSAIIEYQSLLEESKRHNAFQEGFNLTLKLANVLNDASRIGEARKLLFSDDIERINSNDNQRFRLHVARSHLYALSGRMWQALEEIHAALRYFNSNDFQFETQGNLLIRAARYYIKMSAYEEAMTMLPDLIGNEHNYTGGEYKLNLGVVSAMFWVSYGNKQQAENSLNKLESIVKETIDNISVGELPDQYWDMIGLKVEYEQRYHGEDEAMKFICSVPGVVNSTLDTVTLNHCSLLLKYCELSVAVRQTKKLKPYITTILCCSIFTEQWERWRTSLIVARWCLSEGLNSQAIFWAKLACIDILSLSVPLLRSDKQRERIAEEFMLPFNFLENALCSEGRVPEAQAIRSLKINTECEIRFPYFSDKRIEIYSGDIFQIKFSVSESCDFEKWITLCEKAIQYFEQGKPVQESSRRSGLHRFITSKNDEKNIDTQVILENKPIHQIHKDSCRLSYWIYDNKIRVTVESTNTKINLFLEYNLKEVRQEVYNLCVALEAGKEWISFSKYLYKALIYPVLNYISDSSILILSLNDALAYLPFATLYDGEDYLIENYEIIYSHGENLHMTTIENDARMIFLGTMFHSPSEIKLNPQRELESIQKQFQVETVLIDKDWSLQQLNQSFTGASSILHLCCHFVYQAHNPADSFLLLSDGRRLDMRTLLNIDGWERFDLIFLATCNSAIGGIGSDFNANMSLADIFISAGVKRVIASFRPVSDTEAQQFSGCFYSRLRETGSVEQALQLAQRDTIKSNDSIWSAYGCYAP